MQLKIFIINLRLPYKLYSGSVKKKTQKKLRVLNI